MHCAAVRVERAKIDNIEYIIFNMEASMLKVANTFRLFKYKLLYEVNFRRGICPLYPTPTPSVPTSVPTVVDKFCKKKKVCCG